MTADSARGSSDAPELRETNGTAKAASRERRMKEISAQIKNGSYKIDALELSRAIIRKHLTRQR